MKKSRLKKRAKEHTQPWYRKECVKVAKAIAKHRDGYKCVNPGCENSSFKGKQMHGSHIRPESKFLRLSCIPLNIMTQCYHHHEIWHEDPKGQGWFESRFPGRLEKLNEMEARFQKAIVKPDYKKILEELNDEYFKLINGL